MLYRPKLKPMDSGSATYPGFGGNAIVACIGEVFNDLSFYMRQCHGTMGPLIPSLLKFLSEHELQTSVKVRFAKLFLLVLPKRMLLTARSKCPYVWTVRAWTTETGHTVLGMWQCHSSMIEYTGNIYILVYRT